MNKRNPALMLTIIGLAFALLLAIGIGAMMNRDQQTPGGPQPQGQQLNNNDGNPGGILPGGMGNNNAGNDNRGMQIDQGQMENNRRIAQRACDAAENINGVENANAVVMGDTCLLAYEPENRADTNMDRLKETIAERVKNSDKSIKKVVVSDSADIMDRVNQLSNDMTNNRNAESIGSEINDLIQRINPVVR